MAGHEGIRPQAAKLMITERSNVSSDLAITWEKEKMEIRAEEFTHTNETKTTV